MIPNPAKKKKRGAIWFIVVIIIVLAMSSEFADMSLQVGFRDALLSFVLLVLIVLGVVYWIKRSRR
jgi:hypothetical protein